MLSKVNQALDESKDDSFTDLPSELTITEDNRVAVIGNNLKFNMATFEASKKLLREQSAETLTQEPTVPQYKNPPL